MGCTSSTDTSKKPITVEASKPLEKKSQNVNIIVKHNGVQVDSIECKETDDINAKTREILNKYLQTNDNVKYSCVLGQKEIPNNNEVSIQNLFASQEAGNKDTVVFKVIIHGLQNLPKDFNEEYYKTTFIAKPLVSPYEIIIFNENTQKLKIKDISHLTDKMSFKDDSAYCNGRDHLYISGDEGSIWDIDLTSEVVSKSTNTMVSKRVMHSLIFVPSSYVFIVGGKGNKNCEYMNEKKEIIKHSELNEERLEPALSVVNNAFLYAFTNNSKDLSFERINLRSKSNKWELIKPSIDSGLNFDTKFFGVSQYQKDSVVFIGGYSSENSNCFEYNFNNNIIKQTGFKNQKLEFAEKSFFPLEVNNNFLIPHFAREDNNFIVRFTHHDGIKFINFESDDDLQESLPKNRETAAKRNSENNAIDLGNYNIILADEYNTKNNEANRKISQQ